MAKLSVVYSPKIDIEEKKIFKDVFGDNKIIFEEHIFRGVSWGAFDIQIVVDILSDPNLSAFLNGGAIVGLIDKLVKKIFKRNTKKIMDNNSRPRYTILIIKKEKISVIISNVNSDNKVFISKDNTDLESRKNQTEKYKIYYTAEKLKNYLD